MNPSPPAIDPAPYINAPSLNRAQRRRAKSRTQPRTVDRNVRTARRVIAQVSAPAAS